MNFIADLIVTQVWLRT